MKLDSRIVASLKLPDGKLDAIHFDDTLSGFGYRLRRSGDEVRRSWVVQYRHAGASRRLLIGSAEVLGADQARAAAKKILAKVALGEDPQAEKATRRSADKFILATVVVDFLTVKNGAVRPRTFVEAQRYLCGPYFKPLHSMPIDQIMRRDVATQLLAIAREKGAQTAKKARSALSDFFKWAMGQGLTDTNPVVGTNRPKTAPPRERVLSDKELRAIWREVGDDDFKAGNDDFGRIIRLLILLGQRRTEVGGMQWQEIDLESGTWTIPAIRSKNKREHKLSLPPLALDIITNTPRLVGRNFVFGSRAGGYTSWNRPKRLLDAKLGDQVGPWTLHDLRRSFCTRLADLGVLPHVIEAAVNHQSGHKRGPAGVYNRSVYVNEVRAALALWSDHIRSLGEHQAHPGG
jgi:integrase